MQETVHHIDLLLGYLAETMRRQYPFCSTNLAGRPDEDDIMIELYPHDMTGTFRWQRVMKIMPQ